MQIPLYGAKIHHTEKVKMGSDPCCRNLTERPESFRTGLTTKPWRWDFDNLPNRCPCENDSEEQEYREWEPEYQDKARKYVTCKLMDTKGSDTMDKILETIIGLHDRYVFSNSGAVLALRAKK